MKYLKLAALALTSIIFLVFIYIQKTSLPHSGKIKIENLTSQVELYQDQYGIAHIKAQNDKDAYRVLGHFFASQRLFQMEMLKRIVRGTLSEMYGAEFIEADKLLRTFGFYRKAKEVVEYQKKLTTPEAMQQVEAFLEGVNHYIQTQPAPIEFILLGMEPTPFDIYDVVGIGGYMALTFAEGMLSDLTFLDLKEKLNPQMLSTLMSRDSVDWKIFEDKVALPTSQRIQKAINSIGSVAPLFYGSNSWVLAGSRTKSGFPILANDPHIAYSNPAVFIEAHIQYPGFEVYGHFLPLVPFAILGHTPYSAWAITMSETDDMDFYIEKINPENPNQVMFNNEWVELEKISETIYVKDQGPIQLEVRQTPHGPIIDNTKYGVTGYTLSIKWAALAKENNNLETFYQLPRAQNVLQFKNALAHSTSPGLNFSWVHKKGDIAWWVMNRIPKRPDGFIPDMPMPGWNGKYEYIGYLSIDDNPHQVNPTSGMIVTANYKPQIKAFENIPGYWQPGGRYFRIVKLLNSQKKWDVEELKKIQLDSFVPKGSNFTPIYLANVDTSKLAALEIKALDKLKNWDGSSYMQDVASSIYHMTTGILIQDIFRDQLGDKYDTFSKGSDMWAALKTVMHDPNSLFWDNSKTEKVETPSEIITEAFIKAIKELQRRLGTNVDAWQWGKLHLVEFGHPFGKKKPLDLIFNIGPYPADGGRYQINNIAFDKSGTNFSALHGPATRRLIDMSDPTMSWGILPTGNSGNVFDENFDDQTPLYLQGKYRHQVMLWEKINKMPKIIFY